MMHEQEQVTSLGIYMGHQEVSFGIVMWLVMYEQFKSFGIYMFRMMYEELMLYL